MRIDLLQRSLPITENPGIESKDPRFDEVATLVQDGKYIEAAVQCESILLTGVYDIRLICYFLYGYWLEQGLASLTTVIDCLNYVILENWQAIGPVKKREQVVQNSLGWIFRQMLKKIQYEEKKNSVQWQEWQTSFKADDVGKILEASEAFRLSINQQLENSVEENVEAVPECSKIENWLRGLQRLVYHPTEPVQEEAEQLENKAVATQASNQSFPVTAAQNEGLNIEVSYPMVLLLKKLAAFESLLEKDKFQQAALIAEDINQTLAAFDPLVYFPKTFGGFVRLQALNFEELSVYEDYKGSPQWQAMQDWLKTDIDSFMNN